MEFRAATEQALVSGDAVRLADAPALPGWPARIAQEEKERNRALCAPSPGGACASIVGNLFGSRSRLHRALGVSEDAALFDRLIAAGDRPQRIVAGDSLDGSHRRIDRPDLLRELPAIRHSAEDSGPYLTSGILVVRDEEAGGHHFCYVRMAMAGGSRLMVNPATRRMKTLVERGLAHGKPMDVAVLIGPPAEVILSACTSAPRGSDKYGIAQALAGGGLVFAGQGLPVPSATEVVLTGRLLPEFGQEGPVGDQKGLYSLRTRSPACEIDTLWARPEAAFHLIAGGVSREHIELVSLGPRLALHRILRDSSSILSCAMPPFAGGRLAVLVVREDFAPEAVLDRLWAISSVRGFVAVNDDVDPASAPDLLWSLLERARLPEQFRFSAEGHPVSGARKFFIDATSRNRADWNERRIRVYSPEESS